MSAKTVVTGLQALHAGIAGVKSAPTKRPSAINTADLPLVLVRPGAAEWDVGALSQWTVSREYEVAVYVMPVAQGTGVDQGFQKALDLLDLFGLAYLDRTLPGALGVNVRSVETVTDVGLTAVLPFGGVDYTGFVYKVTVKEKAGA